MRQASRLLPLLLALSCNGGDSDAERSNEFETQSDAAVEVGTPAAERSDRDGSASPANLDFDASSAPPNTDGAPLRPTLDASSEVSSPLSPKVHVDAGAGADSEPRDSGSRTRAEVGPPNDAATSVPDEVPFEFSDLRVEDVGAYRAVVRFTTSIETTCELRWGLSADALHTTATDPNMDPDNPYSIDHEVPLEDLAPDTQIFFKAMATTPDGSTQLSELHDFRTLLAPEGGPGRRTNVALLEKGATVVEVSSNYGGAQNDGNFGANAAFDGQMTSEWASNGDGDDAYVVLDFGAPRDVEAFGFRSRKMTDGSSIIQSVRLSFQASDGTREFGPFDTPDPDQRYLFELRPSVVSSRVTISAVSSSGGNTGAKEIEFFAAD